MMNILAISDIHGNENVAPFVRACLKEYPSDIVAVSGDISHFGPSEWITEFLDSLPLPSIAIWGNCDVEGSLEAIAQSKGTCVHARAEKIMGETFYGAGGSTPTPFGTPSEMADIKFYNILAKVAVKDGILLTHVPPFGHLDRARDTRLGGSRAVLRIVKEFRPKLHIFGHIHEAFGVERADGTVFVNPGPAHKNRAAHIKIDGKNVEAKLIFKG